MVTIAYNVRVVAAAVAIVGEAEPDVKLCWRFKNKASGNSRGQSAPGHGGIAPVEPSREGIFCDAAAPPRGHDDDNDKQRRRRRRVSMTTAEPRWHGHRIQPPHFVTHSACFPSHSAHEVSVKADHMPLATTAWWWCV